MAPWGDTKLFFCILFITCCCRSVTFAQIPMDCCLSVKNQVIEKKMVVDYHLQISGQGCSIDAMILEARRGRKMCVPADEPWVQEVVKHVIKLKKFCKTRQYKLKHCTGVKRV